MRSDVIIIVGVGFHDPTQMHLAQDNDVVHTFTPDRSDQPFGKAILPRRGWCGRLVPNAHGAQSTHDNAAIDPVAIADEGARSLIPRKGLRDLTCNPFGRRICCDVYPDEGSAAALDDDQAMIVREPDATRQLTFQDSHLMSRIGFRSWKPQLRLEWRGQHGQNETEQPDHSASLGDSITSSTRIRFSVHTGDDMARR